jgi:hypothetical protein
VELDVAGFDVKQIESVTALEEKNNKKVVLAGGIFSFELLAGEYASFKLSK